MKTLYLKATRYHYQSMNHSLNERSWQWHWVIYSLSTQVEFVSNLKFSKEELTRCHQNLYLSSDLWVNQSMKQWLMMWLCHCYLLFSFWTFQYQSLWYVIALYCYVYKNTITNTTRPTNDNILHVLVLLGYEDFSWLLVLVIYLHC